MWRFLVTLLLLLVAHWHSWAYRVHRVILFRININHKDWVLLLLRLGCIEAKLQNSKSTNIEYQKAVWFKNLIDWSPSVCDQPIKFSFFLEFAICEGSPVAIILKSSSSSWISNRFYRITSGRIDSKNDTKYHWKIDMRTFPGICYIISRKKNLFEFLWY